MARNKLRDFASFKNKNLKTILSGFAVFSLLIGLGASAYTNNYSNTASGSMEIKKGFYLGVSLENSQDYKKSIETRNMSSGDSLDLNFVMKNRANDRSQPAVEILTLDADTDITWRELESLETVRENSTGYSREHRLSVDARGEPMLRETYRNATSVTYSGEVSDTAGRGFGAVSTDLNSDSNDELLVCISESNGYSYSSNETWEGSIEVDTKTSFPAEDLSVEYRLVGLYDPETGTYPPVVRECPQIN